MTQIASATIAALVFAFPLAFLPFRRSRRAEERNALNPAKLFLVYLLVQLGVSGIVSVGVAHLLPFSIDPETNAGVYFKTAVLTLLAVGAFNCGYWNPRRRRVGLPCRAMAAWDPARQLRLAIFLVALGYLGALALIVTYGGLTAMLESREEFRAYGVIGKGYIVYPMTMGLDIGGLLLVDLVARWRPGVLRSATMVAIVVGCMLPAALTGFRGLMMLPVVIVGLYYNYNVRSLYSLRGLAAFGALLLSFIAYGVWRELPAGLDPVKAVEAVAETQPTLFFGPFTRSAGLEATSQIVRAMDTDPAIEPEWFVPGLYEALTISIPSLVWADKPEAGTIRSGRLFFLNSQRVAFGSQWENPGGTSITLIGWGYWQGNVFGVAAAGLLFGLIFRRLVDVQRAWGDLPAVRIGFATLAPALILACEEPQNYINTSVQNLVALTALVLWMSKGARAAPTPGLGVER